MIILPAASTALILIDLQKGIVGMPTAPYSGEAVLAKGKQLAQRFRAARAPVMLVNVAFSLDFGDALKMPVDRPPQLPPGCLPEGWAELADGLAEPSDLRITKRQWGAFHGTELDLQLRRRGVTSVVVGGIAPISAWSRPPGRLMNTAMPLCCQRTPPLVGRPRCIPLRLSRFSRCWDVWRKPTQSNSRGE